jgi:hypothetical protein
MINPQKGIDLMINNSIINIILFAVTIFQHYDLVFETMLTPKWKWPQEVKVNDYTHHFPHLHLYFHVFRHSLPPTIFPKISQIFFNFFF